MKKKSFYLGLLVVIGLALFFFSRKQENLVTHEIEVVTDSPEITPETSASEEETLTHEQGEILEELEASGANAEEIGIVKKNFKAITHITKMYSAPIEFYGKAIDQHGEVVSGAKVTYSVASVYFGEPKKKYKTTNNDGTFSISGLKGSSLYVDLAKDGYHRIAESKGSFSYGSPGSKKPSRDLDNHIIFVLHKKGETEPLVKYRKRYKGISKQGVPINVNLMSGQKTTKDNANFILESWTYDEGKLPNKPMEYAWKCKITVPEGGLIERKDNLDFVAPENGYVQSITYEMPANPTDMKWRNREEKHFFVKLKNGNYARIDFLFSTSGSQILRLNTHINPNKGSLNLEYDKTKDVTTQYVRR